MMNDFTATTMLQPHSDDCLHCLLRKSAMMRCSTRAVCWEIAVPMLRCSFHPLANGARTEAGVTCNLTNFPAFANEFHCFHTNPRKMSIGGVCHRENVPQVFPSY